MAPPGPMLVISDAGADGNVQMATIQLSVMARSREDPTDRVGTALRWIAEELARRILLLLAWGAERAADG